MPPLKYHAGQIAVQEEAKTRVVADQLADWVGPIGEFSLGADLFLLARSFSDGALHFISLSGRPPLVEVAGAQTLRLLFPGAVEGLDEGPVGGLAINLGLARRARVNGELFVEAEGCDLAAAETFIPCRKYMAPSLQLEEGLHVGPVGRDDLDLADPWLSFLLARAETSFLASVSPEGGPDVAHRGGPAGFIELDAVGRRLAWPEFIGDGVFKSAGNVRATGDLTFLVPDLTTGDAVEFIGRGEYTTIRKERTPRYDPLVQHRDPYPMQGRIECTAERAVRLSGFMHPRRRIEKALKVTSASTVDEQAPQ